MRYEYECVDCGHRDIHSRAVANRDDLPYHKHIIHYANADKESHHLMRRVPSIPNIIGEPYHLKEGNRFKGDLTDYKKYRQRYDKMNETHTEKMQEFSTVQAQIYGAEVYKPQKSKSLIEMAKEAGLRG